MTLHFIQEYAEKPFGALVESFGIVGDAKNILTDTLAILHPSSKTKEISYLYLQDFMLETNHLQILQIKSTAF